MAGAGCQPCRPLVLEQLARLLLLQSRCCVGQWPCLLRLLLRAGPAVARAAAWLPSAPRGGAASQLRLPCGAAPPLPAQQREQQPWRRQLPWQPWLRRQLLQGQQALLGAAAACVAGAGRHQLLLHPQALLLLLPWVLSQACCQPLMPLPLLLLQPHALRPACLPLPCPAGSGCRRAVGAVVGVAAEPPWALGTPWEVEVVAAAVVAGA